jgi:DNA-binding NarL/FixJ family response regulator
MQQAQVIAYRLPERLAGLLQELARQHGLWLRDVQHLRTARNLLLQGGPAVFVLMLGGDVVRELALVQELGQASPDTAVVVVGDADNPALAALAWDVGARCVVQPPQPLELLPDIVRRLLPREET